VVSINVFALFSNTSESMSYCLVFESRCSTGGKTFSLSCSDCPFLLTDSDKGNVILLWKAAINIKLHAQKLKFCIRQSAPSHSLCSKPLSFSTAQYNTHHYWPFNIYYRFYMTPVIQAFWLNLQLFWNFIFFIIPPKMAGLLLNKSISLTQFQHKSYKPVLSFCWIFFIFCLLIL